MTHKDASNKRDNDSIITLETLSELSGFPEELIKKELALDKNGKELSMKELRGSMLNFLNSTLKDTH